MHILLKQNQKSMPYRYFSLQIPFIWTCVLNDDSFNSAISTKQSVVNINPLLHLHAWEIPYVK